MKKRMFTMLFAIIMVIAVSIPCVSAATSELTTTKKVSFTAECSKPGYEFSVYKIADLKITTNPYSVKYDVKVSSGEVQAMVADGNLSDANRAKILNALDKDTQLAGATIVGTYKVDTDGRSKTFSNLAQGIYYVRATNFPSGVKKVTNSAFALPYYTAENGWVYDLDTINLAAKVEEDNPDIEKEITNSTQNNVNFTDVSIGDTVEFKIESSVVGAVNDVDVLDFKLNSYVVTDVMSKGLTLNQKSFAVSLEDENDKNLAEIAASDYTVNVADGKFTLTQGDTTLGTFISDSQGRITILYDFDRNTDYTLTETEPQGGYIGLSNPAVFSIGDDGTVTISGNEPQWEEGRKRGSGLTIPLQAQVTPRRSALSRIQHLQ